MYCNLFQNVNLTWNTTSPDFTPCFEKTVLVWVPCIFLWVFSPMEVYYILNSKQKDIPWTWLNISKLVSSRSINSHCLTCMFNWNISVLCIVFVNIVPLIEPVRMGRRYGIRKT